MLIFNSNWNVCLHLVEKVWNYTTLNLNDLNFEQKNVLIAKFFKV